jgi:hypothetical protein
MSGMFRLVFALYLVCCVATQQNFNCYYEEKFLAKVYRLEYRVEMLEEKASKDGNLINIIQLWLLLMLLFQRDLYFSEVMIMII